MSKEKKEDARPDQPNELADSQLAEVAGGLDVNGQGGSDVLLGNRGNGRGNDIIIANGGNDVILGVQGGTPTVQ